MGPDQPGERSEIEKLLGKIGDWLRKTSKLLLASLSLLIIGFFGGIISGVSFFWFLFSIGLTLLAIWTFRQYRGRLPRLLKRGQVLDSWSVLFENGQEKAEEIFPILTILSLKPLPKLKTN